MLCPTNICSKLHHPRGGAGAGILRLRPPCCTAAGSSRPPNETLPGRAFVAHGHHAFRPVIVHHIIICSKLRPGEEGHGGGAESPAGSAQTAPAARSLRKGSLRTTDEKGHREVMACTPRLGPRPRSPPRPTRGPSNEGVSLEQAEGGVSGRGEGTVRESGSSVRLFLSIDTMLLHPHFFITLSYD